MTQSVAEAEFAALLRQAGLTLPAGQQERLRAVFGAVQAMQARIRAPATTATACAEPATTFSAEPGR
jgi:hypothetical protein